MACHEQCQRGSAAVSLDGLPCLRALPSLPAGWLDAAPPVDSPRPGTPCGARPPSSRLRHERGAGQCVAVRHSGLKPQHFASLRDASCPAFLACRRCRSETHDGEQSCFARLFACSSHEEGGRAPQGACRAGLRPPLRNRALGRPKSPGGDFSLWLPPTLGDLLGQVRLRGAALNACPRFADGGRLTSLDACPPFRVRGSPTSVSLLCIGYYCPRTTYTLCIAELYGHQEIRPLFLSLGLLR